MATPARIQGVSRRRIRVDTDKMTNHRNPVTVDIDDRHTMRLMNRHEALYFSLPEHNYVLHLSGAAATSASGLVLRAPQDLQVRSVSVVAGTAPVGADLVLDAHLIAATGETSDAGTTIFTTQANRPTIADGGTVGVSDTPDVTAWAEGEFLKIEVDQVGSGTAGSDLVVTIHADVG